ncbi:MAG: DUF3343 domain-containing protein [Oscillospiraceae bacterium]
MAETRVTDYYILFHNHTEGMTLYRHLRQQGLPARICPVPRAASACCGMSLLVLQEDIDAVKSCIAESGLPIQGIAALPRDIDPRRDHYC